MKCVTNIKSTYTDGKLTITADVVDREFRLPVQQVTVGNTVQTNMRMPRHIQLSTEAMFVKRKGAGVAFDLDEIADVACAIDPGLTDAPVIVKQPTAENLSVQVITELEPFYQWQLSSDETKSWSDISDAKSETFSSGEPGKCYRCVIKNASGATTSNAVQVKPLA